jgi:hypothetical protein
MGLLALMACSSQAPNFNADSGEKSDLSSGDPATDPTPEPAATPEDLVLASVADVRVGNGTFSNVAFDGQHLWVTWGNNHDILAQPLSLDMQPAAPAKTVISSSEVPGGGQISDHAYVYLNGHHYLLFATVGNADLFMARFGASFDRDLPISAIVQDQTATNDPLFTTDGTNLFAGCMCGTAPGSLQFFRIDPALDITRTYVVNDATNLAGITYALGSFYLAYNPFYGESDIYLAQLTPDFVQVGEPVSIIASTDQLEYFPTGISYHPGSGHFLIGHTEGTIGSPESDGYVMARAFDPAWEQTDEAYASTDLATRARTTIVGDTLYLVYDTVNTFEIHLHRYDLAIEP